MTEITIHTPPTLDSDPDVSPPWTREGEPSEAEQTWPVDWLDWMEGLIEEPGYGHGV